MQKLFFIFLLLIFSLSSSTNSHGHLGYFNSPSAYTFDEASLSYGLERGNPKSSIYLTASPFNWFDASLFYVDISDKIYKGSGGKQSYKDKGFSAKFRIKREGRLPAVAVGFNDFAGTGLQRSEYIVLSKTSGNLEYSMGLGWGQYSGGVNVRNPFLIIDDEYFSERNDVFLRGATLQYKSFFRGSASLFGAISYRLNNNLKLIAEYDPTIKPGIIGYKKGESKLNIGIDYRKNNINFKTYYDTGAGFNFQLKYSTNFLEYSNNKKKYFSTEIASYSEMQEVFEKNNIGLKEVGRSGDSIYYKIRQNSYPNQYEVNQIVFHNGKKLIKDNPPQQVHIIHESFGMEMAHIKYKKNVKNVRNEEYSDDDYKDLQYSVKDNFPYVRSSIAPKIRTMLAAREGFLYQGIMLEHDLEYIFNDSLIFISNLKYSISDNFDGLYVEPIDTKPNQVRSDIKKYLNNFDNGIIIGRAELNLFRSTNNSHFFRHYIGILEEMYSGIGTDYIYWPEGSFFSFGYESYFVKKRDYNLRFKHQDYSNFVNRASIQFTEPKTKISFKASYGEYLAGDIGATFTLSRRFNNGVKFSAFFSRSDVSAADFGEGSFDKGVRITIPFKGLFSRKESLTKWEWHPLTKDPQSELIKSINLFEDVQRFRVYTD